MNRRFVFGGTLALLLAAALWVVALAWHGNVQTKADCEGWRLKISANPSEGAHWVASPGESGSWNGNSSVNWSVDFSWDDSNETDHEEGTIYRPDNCDPTATPDSTATPDPTATETPIPTDTPNPTATPESEPSETPTEGSSITPTEEPTVTPTRTRRPRRPTETPYVPPGGKG